MTHAEFIDRLKGNDIIAFPSMDDRVVILRQCRMGFVLTSGAYPIVVRNDDDEVPEPVIREVLRNFKIPPQDF